MNMSHKLAWSCRKFLIREEKGEFFSGKIVKILEHSQAIREETDLN